MNPHANIYAYANFRNFLKDYQKNRHQADKAFTRSRLCQELGLPNTRSYFTDVLNGKPLTREFVERFVMALQLDKNEAQYFRTLVGYNQSENEKEREILFDQLLALNKSPEKLVPKSSYQYYKEWFHSSIRALLDIMDINDDVLPLQKKLYPTVSQAKIEGSIKLLKDLNLIVKNKKGYWKPTDKNITTGAYVADELVKQYQLNCFEMGKKALIDNSGIMKNFTTINLSVSKNMLVEIERKINQLASEVQTIVEKDPDPAEELYQLNLQFYPQTK